MIVGFAPGKVVGAVLKGFCCWIPTCLEGRGSPCWFLSLARAIPSFEFVGT
jgi:hypothetical protein